MELSQYAEYIGNKLHYECLKDIEKYGGGNIPRPTSVKNIFDDIINYDNTSESYLENVTFTNPAMKQYLFQKMNLNIRELVNILTTQYTEVDKCSTDTRNKTWKECKGVCEKYMRQYIEKETRSTAYVLRSLANSVITSDNSIGKITVHIDKNNIPRLSGSWEMDKKYIIIQSYGNVTKNTQNMPNMQNMQNMQNTGRLIMGFGPSASGKSYWSVKILKIFKGSNNFPDSFITIDGGIYREVSLIYRIVRLFAKYLCMAGFSNLVVAGIHSIRKESLFNTRSIKNSIVDYLQIQSRIYDQVNKVRNITINLYCPDTLSNCNTIKDCMNKISKYINITNDKNWIGLLMWQHKYGKDCNYEERFKCIGCTESGKAREIDEGKQYSNSSWRKSMIIGHKMMLQAPGYRLKIHNSGGKKYQNQINVSIIEDYTKYQSPTVAKEAMNIFKKIEKTYGFLYQPK